MKPKLHLIVLAACSSFSCSPNSNGISAESYQPQCRNPWCGKTFRLTYLPHYLIQYDSFSLFFNQNGDCSCSFSFNGTSSETAALISTSSEVITPSQEQTFARIELENEIPGVFGEDMKVVYDRSLKAFICSLSFVAMPERV